MTILYVLIANAHSKAVLAEYGITKGNFRTVTALLLRKLETEAGKTQIVYDNYVFNYICFEGVYYMALTDDNKSRLPFALLDDILSEFTTKYNQEQIVSAIAYGFDSDFSNTIKSRLEFYNSPDADSFMSVNNKLHEVKEIMSKNIEQVLGRGEKLELLVEKAEKLVEGSEMFLKRTKQLKSALMWRNLRWYLLILVAVGIGLWLLTSAICGFDYESC